MHLVKGSVPASRLVARFSRRLRCSGWITAPRIRRHARCAGARRDPAEISAAAGSGHAPTCGTGRGCRRLTSWLTVRRFGLSRELTAVPLRFCPAVRILTRRGYVRCEPMASKTCETEATTRSTSSSEVCQQQTLTRIARRPRHTVPPKNASPFARIAAITSSVRRS